MLEPLEIIRFVECLHCPYTNLVWGSCYCEDCLEFWTCEYQCVSEKYYSEYEY